ncbi:MAG: response regulator transcription factor [Clostridia bacterium]|nr:response regulator transcription factor [Clostridia bacterium]
MKHILIVEDDAVLAAGLCRALTSPEIKTTSCETLHDAQKMLLRQNWSLILLDVNLPDGNGFDFLTELRQTTQLPVILLTANDLETDIVSGLELGADDYITKPFSLAVLRARVNTQLRRIEQATVSNVITLGRFSFDFDRMVFTADGVPVELSKTEQKLLRILVENRGMKLSRSDLVDRIWTDGAEYVDENALSVTVKRLRDKLGAQDTIKTVYGIGYMWVKTDV